MIPAKWNKKGEWCIVFLQAKWRYITYHSYQQHAYYIQTDRHPMHKSTPTRLMLI